MVLNSPASKACASSCSCASPLLKNSAQVAKSWMTREQLLMPASSSSNDAIFADRSSSWAFLTLRRHRNRGARFEQYAEVCREPHVLFVQLLNHHVEVTRPHPNIDVCVGHAHVVRRHNQNYCGGYISRATPRHSYPPVRLGMRATCPRGRQPSCNNTA
jgi:hypothetical protein